MSYRRTRRSGVETVKKLRANGQGQPSPKRLRAESLKEPKKRSIGRNMPGKWKRMVSVHRGNVLAQVRNRAIMEEKKEAAKIECP
jgi:hypothetical protein